MDVSIHAPARGATFGFSNSFNRVHLGCSFRGSMARSLVVMDQFMLATSKGADFK